MGFSCLKIHDRVKPELEFGYNFESGDKQKQIFHDSQ